MFRRGALSNRMEQAINALDPNFTPADLPWVRPESNVSSGSGDQGQHRDVMARNVALQELNTMIMQRELEGKIFTDHVARAGLGTSLILLGGY